MHRFRSSHESDLLGAHVSTAGGAPTIFERGRAIGANALAFFSKNNNRWKAKDLDDQVVDRFARLRAEHGNPPLAIHASYLINLAATSQTILARSIGGMIDELRRASRLGVKALVLHPGAHMGAGVDRGIDRVARSMDRVHALAAELDVVTLFETSAGQGSCLGHTFEELGSMIEKIDDKNRVGVCVDTCHIFAAGYDFRTSAGWESVVDELDRRVGIERVALFHLNDSKRALGSRVDRHEHIGQGEIGLEPFGFVLNDPRFARIPKVLETPKTDPVESDLENLARLRSLID